MGALAKDACVVFSKSYCPYCVEVKKLLKSLGASFEAYELDKMGDGSSIQQELGKRTGGTSVPRVFINKEFIGGCDGRNEIRNSLSSFSNITSGTKALHSKGGLVPKLESAGVLGKL